jgi:glucans biosynthesis protein
VVVLWTGLVVSAQARTEAPAFGFEQLIDQARSAAAQPYAPPADALPPAWQALDYDALRHIRFRPQAAWWRDQALPFELQAFHLGGGLRHAVALHEIVDGRARALAYDPAHWDFGPLEATLRASAPRGHAGFRVHHALNRAGVMDELVVFLGASYFRALGRGQVYGLSARGLAIDTVDAAPGSAEEFPRFTAFWIERPTPGAQALVVLAQMDSPRATGAYRFTVRPGEETVVEVQARVFLRPGAAPLRALGIAPLTSMFQHGPQQPRASDYRPRVHDSDGLLLAAVGPGAAAGAVQSAPSAGQQLRGATAERLRPAAARAPLPRL